MNGFLGCEHSGSLVRRMARSPDCICKCHEFRRVTGTVIATQFLSRLRRYSTASVVVLAMPNPPKTVSALVVITNNPRTESTLRQLLDGEFYAIYVDRSARALPLIERNAADLVLLDLSVHGDESVVVTSGVIRTQYPDIPIIGVADPREMPSSSVQDLPSAFTFGMTTVVTLGDDDLVDVLRRQPVLKRAPGYVPLFRAELDAIPDTKVRAFCQYVLARPYRKHTLASVAQALELNPEGVQSAFERLHLQSPGWLIRRSAMLAGATLVAERRWPAAPVSETLGYESADTLRRALRRHAAMAAGEGMDGVVELCIAEIRDALQTSQGRRHRPVMRVTL
jgi:AraC-like DNA-binding protein